MSIQAVAWALEQDVPDAAAKLVLISLANALNGKTGKCFPTIEQICKESSCSKSTVLRKLKWLESEGWIEVNAEFADDGRQRANSYTLGCQFDTGRVSGWYGEGVRGDTHGGSNCDTPLKEPEEIPEAAATRGKSDLDELQEKLLDAVGEGNIQPHGCIDLSAILGLIAAGVDLETDILPTIRARAVKLRRPVGSWAYFTEPIRDAYNRRIEAGKGLLKPRATGEAPKGWVEGMSADEASEKWVKTLNFARPRAQWKTWLWGPPPGQDGCQVPADLMEARDLERNWFEEKAPEAA